MKLFSPEVPKNSKQEDDEDSILVDGRRELSKTWIFMLNKYLSRLSQDIPPSARSSPPYVVDVCQRIKGSDRWVVTISNFTWCGIAKRQHSEAGKIYYVFMIQEGMIYQKCHSAGLATTAGRRSN